MSTELSVLEIAAILVSTCAVFVVAYRCRGPISRHGGLALFAFIVCFCTVVGGFIAYAVSADYLPGIVWFHFGMSMILASVVPYILDRMDKNGHQRFLKP